MKMLICVIVALATVGVSASAQQGKKKPAPKKDVGIEVPQSKPAEALAPMVDDQDLRQKTEQFEKLMEPFEKNGTDIQKELNTFLDERNKAGSIENLTPMRISELQIQLGRIAKKAREQMTSFVEKKREFGDLLVGYERNSQVSEVNATRDLEDAKKLRARIEGDTLIKDDPAQQALLAAVDANLFSHNARIQSIRTWNSVRGSVKERSEKLFAVAGYCVEILSDCEKILLEPSNVGTALARLEAHVSNLQAFTFKLAEETKRIAGSLVPKT